MLLHRLGAVTLIRNEVAPFVVSRLITARGDKVLILIAFGYDDMGNGVDHGDVGAGFEWQMVCTPSPGCFEQVNLAGVDHDQLGALTQTTAHCAAKYRVCIGGVGTHNDHHIGIANRIEGLGSGGLAQCHFQAIAGWAVTDTGAGVGIIVAETGTNKFLNEVGFFVSTARARDTAHRVSAVFLLHGFQFAGRK